MGEPYPFISRGAQGELLIYGWALFGHILPRIQFEHFPCYPNGEPVDEVGETGVVGAYQREAFVIEWAGKGTCIAFGKPEKR